MAVAAFEQPNQDLEHQLLNLEHLQAPDVIPDWVMDEAPVHLSQEAPTAVDLSETAEDIYTRREAAEFIGACLTGHEVQLSLGEKSSPPQSIESLHDAIQLAAEGDERARKMVATNVKTDMIERTMKTGHVIRVDLNVNEAGKIQQHGQTMESVQANSLRLFAGNSERMLKRAEAETVNAFRIQEAYDNGELEDHYLVAFSRPDDEMSLDEMKEAGFFTDNMSTAIQVTSVEDGVLFTESAFVSGVKNKGGERHDARTLAGVGEELGVDFEGKSSTEALGTMVKIPKRMMPNGVVDLVKLWDSHVEADVSEEIFFGEVRRKQDYLEYLDECLEREERFQPKVEEVTQQLINRAPTLKHAQDEVVATEVLAELSEAAMVEQALGDSDIDPYVFGNTSASHIIEAREYLARGEYEEAQASMVVAKDTADSTSCPGGPRSKSSSGESDSDGGGGEPGDCEFISKECPKCKAKNVKTKVSKGKISGECGCSARLS